MDMFAPDRLHVVACDSGAGSLMKAASDRGCRGIRDRTLILVRPTLFSVGPIGGIASPAEHFRWLSANIPGAVRFTGLDGHESSAARGLEENWAIVRSWSGPITLWHCSRNIVELSFYLTFSNTVPHSADVDIVDTATIGEGINGTGECRPEQLISAFADAYRLSEEDLRRDRERFQRLSAAPAGVRVFDDTFEMFEAAIDVHDDRLFRHVSSDWTPTRDVAAALFKAESDRGVREIEYAFMLWRLEILCLEGRLTRRGESDKPHDPLKGEIRKTA